jgi:universal stress protein A
VPAGSLTGKSAKEVSMSIQRIACCTDFSSNANKAFVNAMDLAAKYDARLFLVHVLPSEINPALADTAARSLDDTRRALIPELQERMQAEYGQRLEGHVEYKIAVLYGHVSSEILAFIGHHKMDLVIMGSYGLAGIELVFFGSVAKRVAHKAPCSVLIVR